MRTVGASVKPIARQGIQALNEIGPKDLLWREFHARQSPCQLVGDDLPPDRREKRLLQLKPPGDLGASGGTS